jgi:hypothetical protein
MQARAAAVRYNKSSPEKAGGALNPDPLDRVELSHDNSRNLAQEAG